MKLSAVWMDKAIELSKEADCIRGGVGAVLVMDKQIFVGKNGCEYGKCSAGNCFRCAVIGNESIMHDMCFCIHAEKRVVVSCLTKFFTCLGGILYVTLRPCIPCLTFLEMVGIKSIYYLEKRDIPKEFEENYQMYLKEVFLHCEQFKYD